MSRKYSYLVLITLHLKKKHTKLKANERQYAKLKLNGWQESQSLKKFWVQKCSELSERSFRALYVIYSIPPNEMKMIFEWKPRWEATRWFSFVNLFYLLQPVYSHHCIKKANSKLSYEPLQSKITHWGRSTQLILSTQLQSLP